MVRGAGELIASGGAILGMELGSTRIKAVLIDGHGGVLASGTYQWENRLENGIWTYHLEDMIAGVQHCYRELSDDVLAKYGVRIRTLRSIGLSGMMHGYLAFDEEWRLLTPFRTWRNTITREAAELLTDLLGFHIPQRWGVAHLCRAILNREAHLERLCHQTTLTGYLHYLLTGENLIGFSEASGMFPVDANGQYDDGAVQLFDSFCKAQGYDLSLRALYPRPMAAGAWGGELTEEGARLLDPSGNLMAGIPACPPEGDGGTGMVASNCVRSGVGSLSMGTSAFAMAVLEQPLKGCYEELDVMATPTGKPVVLVHCNNCTGEIDAWVELISQIMGTMGAASAKDQIYRMLYEAALNGADDTLVYNYISGEHIPHVERGVPMLLRAGGTPLNLNGVARGLIYSAVATLRMGMDVLTQNEDVRISCVTAHGGFFKTPRVGQLVVSAALKLPVAVMETAGEGGAWAMALLALYAVDKRGETLEAFLENRIFGDCPKTVLEADSAQQADFDRFMVQFQRGLKAERFASEIYGAENACV